MSLRQALRERERPLGSARAVSRPDDHLEHFLPPSVRLLARGLSHTLRIPPRSPRSEAALLAGSFRAPTPIPRPPHMAWTPQ